MGYKSHNAIIVTSYNMKDITKARLKAQKIFADYNFLVSEIVLSPEICNRCLSFFIAPDGGYDGWARSNICDQYRQVFIDWLESNEGYDWIEIQYGDDDGNNIIVKHSTK